MTSTTEITREIKYSRSTKDYDCFVDGQYVGSRANYSDGETLCDQIVADMIADAACATATALDHGCAIEDIAADTLVIRAAAPGQSAAYPVQADALLLEADAVLSEAVCETCEGEGRIPCGDGCGDQAGGWAETCQECKGSGKVSAPTTCQILGCTLPAQHRFLDYDDAYHYRCCAHYHAEGYECLCAQLRQTCILCGGDHSAENCPLIHPRRCAGFLPGACGNTAPAGSLFCAQCAGGLDRLVAALACAFCGEPHESAACPLRRPLVVPAPTTCKACGGQHSIQQCGTVRARLFAA